VRTPESPKSGFLMILSLRKPSWTTRGGLQAISGQNCRSQHHPPGDHKLIWAQNYTHPSAEVPRLAERGGPRGGASAGVGEGVFVFYSAS
jgi:hypothetical protein